MECPYCGLELNHYDEFGRFEGGRMVEKLGDEYECVYGRGEEIPEEFRQRVLERLSELEGKTVQEYIKDVLDGDVSNLECSSDTFNGLFYSYVGREDDLNEGKPC